jgi:hypothetical protein
MRYRPDDAHTMRLDLLVSPAFIAATLLLAANDWLLKPLLHNWLTGKLSDFAGLTAITLFGLAFFPRNRWAVAALVAVAFTYWKSPYSQSVIDLVNDYSPFWIGRTVDYTDLIALPMIWIACCLAPAMRGISSRRWLQQAIAVLSLVVFTGTSYIDSRSVRETARLPIPEAKDAIARMEEELRGILDGLAASYNLDCLVCESLIGGRLYGDRRSYESGWSDGLWLMARLDHDAGELFYDIRKEVWNSKVSNPEIVDSLRDALQKELRARFPILKTQPAPAPESRAYASVDVYKRNSSTTYRDPENQRDYERAKSRSGKFESTLNGLWRGVAA